MGTTSHAEGDARLSVAVFHDLKLLIEFVVGVEHDEIGIFFEVKLEIIGKYAAAYTTVMEAQRRDTISRLRWLYIDGYAGSRHQVSKARMN